MLAAHVLDAHMGGVRRHRKPPSHRYRMGSAHADIESTKRSHERSEAASHADIAWARPMPSVRECAAEYGGIASRHRPGSAHADRACTRRSHLMSGVRRHYTPMHTPPSHGLDPCLQRAHSTLTRRSHGRSAARVRRHRKPPSTRPWPWPWPPLRLGIRRTQSGVRWHRKLSSHGIGPCWQRMFSTPTWAE